MMVLTEYLSSGWRVMRHLSNLNIFHWAVMALSPGPHVCGRRVCSHLCASLEKCLKVNHICMGLCGRMRVLVEACKCSDSSHPP